MIPIKSRRYRALDVKILHRWNGGVESVEDRRCDGAQIIDVRFYGIVG